MPLAPPVMQEVLRSASIKLVRARVETAFMKAQPLLCQQLRGFRAQKLASEDQRTASCFPRLPIATRTQATGLEGNHANRVYELYYLEHHR